MMLNDSILAILTRQALYNSINCMDFHLIALCIHAIGIISHPKRMAASTL